MSWFQKKTEAEKLQADADKQRRGAARAEQEASLSALELGGLPTQAQRRLSQMRERGGTLFTSDLTVNEFLLARQSGMEAVSQVMGSSVFHVGWQYMPNSWRSRSGELSVISGALNKARSLALGRLEQEARLVGGDAVIGVHVERGEYDWAADLVEFNVVGTAVRVTEASEARPPLGMTNLSGQDFWKLYRGGYWPVGVVAASTVFYVVASWQTQTANNSWWGQWANQELTDFTQGLYAARHIAMSNVHRQASVRAAHGVVGMQIEQEEDEHEVELSNDRKRTDMIFTFHAMGTAVVEMENHGAAPPVHSVVNLTSESGASP